MNDLPTHYRFIDGQYDIHSSGYSRPPKLYRYNASRETRCGYWLRMSWGKDKWVSKTSRIRYAYPTEEEAKDSYIIRKQRQVMHCRHQIKASLYFITVLGVEPWKEDEWLSF